jgi:hypothetical protein
MPEKSKARAPATAVPAPITEQRAHPRYPFTAAVEAYDPATKLRMKGRTSDLSRGGCYVDTISPFGVGTVAKVRFTKNEKTFDVEARVVYSQPGMGMGIMFTALLPEQSGVVDRWIGEITGEVTTGSDEDVFGPPAGGGDNAAATKLKEEQQYVLNDLVITLMRNGILREPEGKAMLAKLHR